jgi:DNA-directed RNA polymerase subunit E'/Rpb7
MEDSLTNLYQTSTASCKIHIHPKWLTTEDLDEAIANEIKQKVEGNCNRDGYVKKGSVTVIKRSAGMATSNETNGLVSFDVVYQVQICFPVANQKMICRIKTSNKIGFHVIPCYEHGQEKLDEDENPLVIIIPKQRVDSKTILPHLKENLFVLVRIIGSRFDLGDDKISVVGTITHFGDNAETLLEKLSASEEKKGGEDGEDGEGGEMES